MRPRKGHFPKWRLSFIALELGRLKFKMEIHSGDPHGQYLPLYPHISVCPPFPKCQSMFQNRCRPSIFQKSSEQS